MIDVIMQTLAMLAFAAGGFAAGCRATIARNAAHVECLGCTHYGPNKPLRAAQLAAQAHRRETGHIAMVVSKHG